MGWSDGKREGLADPSLQEFCRKVIAMKHLLGVWGWRERDRQKGWRRMENERGNGRKKVGGDNRWGMKERGK